MARINTTQLIIKISKLQKDNEENDTLISSDLIMQLEEIIAELVGEGVMIEADELTVQ
jgi:hypothetical protein